MYIHSANNALQATDNAIAPSDRQGRSGVRSAFFISDGTAITAETMGRSLLGQFHQTEFNIVIIPYVETLERASEVVVQINAAYATSGLKPLVFDTIVSDDIREKINSADACNLDIYEGIIAKISDEVGERPKLHKGVAHGVGDSDFYNERIDAVHFALDNDDGARVRHYDRADIILVGLSRSGKTPTSLYLALQFGIYAANYPLTEEDLDNAHLPAVLQPFRHKIFGLAIDTERLVKIREERMAGSRYASMAQCQNEQRAIARIYANENIPSLNVTQLSVEEIATRVLQMAGLNRRIG